MRGIQTFNGHGRSSESPRLGHIEFLVESDILLRTYIKAIYCPVILDFTVP